MDPVLQVSLKKSQDTNIRLIHIQASHDRTCRIQSYAALHVYTTYLANFIHGIDYF